MVPFDQTSCGVTRKLLSANRRTDANATATATGLQGQIVLCTLPHCSVTAKDQDKFTRHQNVERYRRLLKSATNEERGTILIV